MSGHEASKLFALCAAALLLGCGGDSPTAAPDHGSDAPARPAFCGRVDDEVSRLFCGERAADVASLEDLKRELDLDRVLLLGHSTALNGRLVSTINPRAILMRRDDDFADGYTAGAFTRGEQRVELISFDVATRRFNLYLMSFEQACNDEPGGCSYGDLFTPAIESGWRELRIHDDEELKNTPEDCRRCHGGAPEDGGKPMLLMREVDGPWLHWFSQFTPLPMDYKAAKGDELYAGEAVDGFLEQPFLLESHVRFAEQALGQRRQPISFLSGVIALETAELQVGLAAEGGGEPNRSPTWQLLYDNYREGRAPAPPYHHMHASDPDKLATASQAYRAFLDGELAQDELPNLSDVLPDDATLLAEMSFAVHPDAQGERLLIEACGDCHNASLDQSLSRARFDIDLSRVSRATLALASARLERGEDDPSAMPPPGARRMTRGQRRALSEYLQGIDPDAVTPRPGPQATFDEYALEPGYGYQAELPSDAISIGDLSGDGAADLVCGPWLFEQGEDGSFEGPKELAAMPSASVALVDVNGDGRLDIVSRGVEGDDATGLTTFVAEGELRFSAGIRSEGPPALDLERGNFADLDGDGHLDFVTRAEAGSLVLFTGDGAGSFRAGALPLDLSGDQSVLALALGELTGDGAADLVLLMEGDEASIDVFAHDGRGGFSPSGTRYAIPDGLPGDFGLSIGDANQDGRNDIAISPGLRLLLQGEDGGFEPGPIILVNFGPAMFFDMNADGLQDLVALAADTGEVRVLLQGELGLLRPADIATLELPSLPGTVLDMLEVGDISGDGCPDVAVARTGSIMVVHGRGCAR